MGKRSSQTMHPLDIRKIYRAGLLQPGKSFAWEWTSGGNRVAGIDLSVETSQVILSYRTRGNNGEWQDMDYPVRVTWTPCNYGGHRPWWCCPIYGCGQRVAVLFGGRVYACRRCQKVAYQSTRETPIDQAIRRAEKARKRLGWITGIVNGAGAKPKGMHAKTFERLQAMHDASAYRALMGLRLHH